MFYNVSRTVTYVPDGSARTREGTSAVSGHTGTDHPGEKLDTERLPVTPQADHISLTTAYRVALAVVKIS